MVSMDWQLRRVGFCSSGRHLTVHASFSSVCTEGKLHTDTARGLQVLSHKDLITSQ